MPPLPQCVYLSVCGRRGGGGKGDWVVSGGGVLGVCLGEGEEGICIPMYLPVTRTEPQNCGSL